VHPDEQLPLDLTKPPVDPGPGRRTNTIGHPVERMLNASARDILDALENGFRARADLKGKLAELFMSRHLDDLQRTGVVDHYEWQDLDGVPDFVLYLGDGSTRTLEVKNVRSGHGPLRVETQKTRASRGDPWSRYYRADQFDFIAPCLFNATGRWEYLFARTAELARDREDPNLLATMQQIAAEPGGIWRRELVELLG
jgi:hypothetical protein